MNSKTLSTPSLENYYISSDLVEVSSSSETLLLCSATSANLTSLPLASSPAPLASSHALLSALVMHPASSSSVHIQEQVVTVINNITRSTSTCVTSGSVVVVAVDYLLDLLSLAQLPPTDTEHFITAKRTVTKAVIGEYF